MADGMIFDNRNSLVRAGDFEKAKRRVALEMAKIKDFVAKKEDWYRVLSLPADRKICYSILEKAKQKLNLNISALIVVGIGGSNLGALAVHEALNGKMFNGSFTNGRRLNVYFADTVDSDTVAEILGVMEAYLKSEKNVLLNLISESGRTTETIANFEVFLELLKRHRKDYQKYVVVTTTKESKLHNLALKQGFDTLETPAGVGGRYSVFSPVGLFPLAFIGIDVKSLVKGAASMNERCFREVSKSPAAQSAIDLYCNYREGKCIHDFFVFSDDFESLGKWYRQLLAESLGKKYSIKGYKVKEGITPTVSVGSTDLHSLGQLYLSGPFNRFTTFMKVEPRRKVKVPKEKDYNELVEGIQGKSLAKIMDAIYNGTRLAFIKGKRPFNQVTLRKKEYDVGQYMQYEMIKTVILGHLLYVNPFDQPAVEEYKHETREILRR